jgi:hypothetical protein
VIDVNRAGTGVCRTLHVPERSSKLTLMQSLAQAKKNVGWDQFVVK